MQLTHIRGIKYIYTENIFIYCWLGFIGECSQCTGYNGTQMVVYALIERERVQGIRKLC